MSFLEALFYGVVQGITEFAPVSSSGHLAILPHFLNIKDPGVFFDLSMHMGTALAIIFYFSDDVKKILGGLFKKEALSLNMTISTLTTVVFIFLIKGYAKDYGRALSLIAFNLIFFGILMWVADVVAKKNSTGMMTEKVRIKEAALIGIFQALAIFPGVSRSGSTLTISRFLSLSREEAASYSFLLSLPIIIAGFIYKLPEALNAGSSFDFLSCIIGIVVSFVVGYLTIHYFMKIISKVGLYIFSVYRIALAGIIFFFFI